MGLVADVRQKSKELKNWTVPNEETVAAYHTMRQQLANLRQGLHAFIVKPQFLVPFLQAGRMVILHFHPLYLVLSSFTQFYPVSRSFTQFYPVLPSFT